MGYHYLGLVDHGTSAKVPSSSDTRADLMQAFGLRPSLTAGALTLLVGRDTPALSVATGVVIGHLFARDGTPATAASLPSSMGPRQFASHLLRHYWGDYLLIQRAGDHTAALSILRDPSGGVPCFYAMDGDTGFIASDISLATGLGLYRRRVDWTFVAQSLAYPHVKTAHTGLAGVRELLPGCSLEIGEADATVWTCWSPWTFVSPSSRHQARSTAIAGVRAAVATVTRSLAETDEAILMELSGGLDSSIVATSLRGARAEVACCTLVTPVPGADERQYARQVTDALGLELHTEALGFANACFDHAPPAATATPRLGVLQRVSHEAMQTAARAHGATSFFSGAGGDSVFCYMGGATPAADAYLEHGLSAGIAAIRDLSKLHQCTYWKAGRLTLKKILRGAKAPYTADASFLTPSAAVSGPEPHPWLAAPAGALPGDRERIADLAATQVFRDSAPRGSTRHLRFPLLSQPVMEACLKVPSWMWIDGGENRAIARAAFADRLPRGVLERRSKGTFMNYFGAIYQRRTQAMREYLLTGQLEARGFLDTSALEAYFAAPLAPRDTSFMRIFDLCMIESWTRHQDQGEA